MRIFWKRKSPFWHIAFLFLLSLLLSWGVRQAPPSPPLQQAAQDWVDDCLGFGVGRVTLLESEPSLKMVATLNCSEAEAETVGRGLHTLLSTDPRRGEQILVVLGPAPIHWQGLVPPMLWLAAGGLGLLGYGLLRKRPELNLRGSGWARALTLGSGCAFLGLAWESSPYRLSFVACSLLCFCWNRLQCRQARREIGSSRLTPPQEAAVLMMSLPPEVAAEIFKELGPDDVHRITHEICRLPSIAPEVRERVLDRFMVLSSLDLRKSARGGPVARALSRRYLAGDKEVSPEQGLWLPTPVRWSSLAFHLLGGITLLGWLWGLQALLPAPRPSLQGELGRFLGTPLKVVQCERGPGATGVVVSLPDVPSRRAETTLPLVRDRLAALGLAPERTLVVATRPRDLSVQLLAIFAGLVLPFSLLGRLVFLWLRKTRYVKPEPATGSEVAQKRRRRVIFECPECHEVFVDGESLSRHREVIHPSQEPPKALVTAETVPAEIAPARKPEVLMELLRVDAVSMELGRRLLGLVDPDQGAKLSERVTSIRRHMALESGLVVPGIRFRDNLQLRAQQYTIKIRDLEVASGEVLANSFLAIGPENRLASLKGELVKDPTYGMPGVWICPDRRGDAERLGCMLFDPVSVIATHLTETLRHRLAEIFTLSECKALLDAHPNLVAVREALAERGIDEAVIWKALSGMLRERICIRDLEVILQSFLDGPAERPDLLAELARTALSGWICQQWANNDKVIQVLTLEPSIESLLERARTPDGWLDLAPEQGEEILQAIAGPVQMLMERGLEPVILTSPSVRPVLRKLSERSFPRLTILSWNEIDPGYQVNSLEMIRL